MDVKLALDQAILALKAGDKTKARQLLEAVLDADERNESAWLWLSSVVESDEERLICLENVLTINPHNERARQGLVALGAAPPGVEGLQPVAPQPAALGETPASDMPAGRPSPADRRIFIVITIALVLILICTVVGILAFVTLSP